MCKFYRKGFFDIIFLIRTIYAKICFIIFKNLCEFGLNQTLSSVLCKALSFLHWLMIKYSQLVLIKVRFLLLFGQVPFLGIIKVHQIVVFNFFLAWFEYLAWQIFKLLYRRIRVLEVIVGFKMKLIWVFEKELSRFEIVMVRLLLVKHDVLNLVEFLLILHLLLLEDL